MNESPRRDTRDSYLRPNAFKGAGQEFRTPIMPPIPPTQTTSSPTPVGNVTTLPAATPAPQPAGPMPAPEPSVTATGTGNVDPKSPAAVTPTSGTYSTGAVVSPADARKKVQDLAQNWGTLPEAERVKAIRDMQKDLPPQYRDVVQNYFKQLSRAEGQQPDQTRVKLLAAIEEVDKRVAVTGKTNEAAKKLADGWSELGDQDREKAVLLLSEVKEKAVRATSCTSSTSTKASTRPPTRKRPTS